MVTGLIIFSKAEQRKYVIIAQELSWGVATSPPSETMARLMKSFV